MSLTPAERGRLGGQRTVDGQASLGLRPAKLAQRHGVDHMRAIASKGGQAVVEQRGIEHMSAIGKVGFAATVERVFGGDRKAAIRRWVKIGLKAQDPFPENGAWQEGSQE